MIHHRLKMSDLARPGFKANPHEVYAWLRAEVPVYRTRFLGRPAWLVTRYDDVTHLLKQNSLVKDWPPVTRWLHFVCHPLTHHMLNKDGANHARLRRLGYSAFTPVAIEQLRSRIQTVCEELLNRLTTSHSFDLVREFALPLPLTIIAEILGIPATDRKRIYTRIQSSVSPSTIPEVLLAVPDQRILTHQIRKLVAQRRCEPRDDLLTTLVRAGTEGELSDEELIGSIFFLLVAGHETTINLVAVGTLALLQNDSERRRFAQNPAISESAIEELLRYTSPLDVATHRFAQEDIVINSVKISRGDAVFAVLGSANRDETQFPDPETLNLTRAPNRHVALGQGMHFCLGAPLARLEALVALRTLFRHFPDLRVAQSPKSLRWRRSLFIRGLKTLLVEG
jgi:cytochrome P450